MQVIELRYWLRKHMQELRRYRLLDKKRKKILHNYMIAQNKNKYIKLQGFTLIELLVVIGILAILLAITLIAINPARQFGLANDTKRRSDATELLNAIGQYAADPANSGQLPPALSVATSSAATEIN